MSIEVYVKRNTLIYPPSWSDCYVPLEADEEQHLFTAGNMEIKRDEDELENTYQNIPGVLHPQKHKAIVENYQLSDRFILVDLYRPENRLKKYRRCGFSTKRKLR